MGIKRYNKNDGDNYKVHIRCSMGHAYLITDQSIEEISFTTDIGRRLRYNKRLVKNKEE